MKILVSGAGIAGLTQAYWLAKAGFDVVIVERSPQLRDEGYMIDFSAEGVQIADAMGILDDLYDASANLKALEFVSKTGKSQGGFKISDVQKLMKEKSADYMPLMRGDLERVLANALPENIEIRFATTIKSIDDQDETVEVQFSSGAAEKFDLVIIAEGIHSPTRALVFGPEENYIHPLKSIIAIARIKGGGAALNGVAKTNIDVGNYVISTPTSDGDVISVYAFSSDAKPPRDQADAKALLRSKFAPSNKFAQRNLDQIGPDTDLFIDQVAQIRNPDWCKGRVALIGDAASCMTFLSGQGSIMAMAQAYVLAHELATCEGDHSKAFGKYQSALRSDIDGKMNVAAKVSALIPETKLQLLFFKFVAHFIGFRFAQRILFASYLKPTIFNKGYPLH